MEDLREPPEEVEQGAARFGLQLSPKTEYMVVTRAKDNPAHGHSIRVGVDVYRRVDAFKYLGSMVTTDNDLDAEIRARATAGMRQYYSLIPLMKFQRLSRTVKARLHSAIVRPAMI